MRFDPVAIELAAVDGVKGSWVGVHPFDGKRVHIHLLSISDWRLAEPLSIVTSDDVVSVSAADPHYMNEFILNIPASPRVTAINSVLFCKLSGASSRLQYLASERRRLARSRQELAFVLEH